MNRLDKSQEARGDRNTVAQSLLAINTFKSRWVGRGGAIVVPVHHRRTLFLCYAASVGALKAKPPTESERPRQ